MMQRRTYLSAVGLALMGGACVPMCDDCSGQPDMAAENVVYLGAETRLLDDDIVNFRVRVDGAGSAHPVADYAECAAAQYTMIRGYGFARHIRTGVTENNGQWLGDAYYTISSSLPNGTNKIDAEVVLAACNENGIPTV